jgi:hypothetical protein
LVSTSSSIERIASPHTLGPDAVSPDVLDGTTATIHPLDVPTLGTAHDRYSTCAVTVEAPDPPVRPSVRAGPAPL